MADILKFNDKIQVLSESFTLKEELDPVTKKPTGIKITGKALTPDKPTRNKVAYSQESLQATYQSLIGKPFLDSHQDNSIRNSPPFGHVTNAYMTAEGLFYEVDIDPAEQTFIRKAKRGDITGVSIQVLVQDVEQKEGYVRANVQEFLELSAVLIPGDGDTTIKLSEAFSAQKVKEATSSPYTKPLDTKKIDKQYEDSENKDKVSKKKAPKVKPMIDKDLKGQARGEYVKCPSCKREIKLKDNSKDLVMLEKNESIQEVVICKCGREMKLKEAQVCDKVPADDKPVIVKEDSGEPDPCEECGGTGYTDDSETTECPECHGDGFISEALPNEGQDIEGQPMPVPKKPMLGKGETDGKDVCPHCGAAQDMPIGIQGGAGVQMEDLSGELQQAEMDFRMGKLSAADFEKKMHQIKTKHNIKFGSEAAVGGTGTLPQEGSGSGKGDIQKPNEKPKTSKPVEETPTLPKRTNFPVADSMESDENKDAKVPANEKEEDNIKFNPLNGCKRCGHKPLEEKGNKFMCPSCGTEHEIEGNELEMETPNPTEKDKEKFGLRCACESCKYESHIDNFPDYEGQLYCPKCQETNLKSRKI